ncbi:hypothetical protein H5410_042101 [Solanum commersonii]|uniref:Reverse transcriptase domain, Reverse transcriptase zinc-binding domain protein n=1 Tax=Solanum commersonii TaxID=4109 RepID=A0A9J5XTE2_SOLCO|nr:hypothetical protein H5410_042101 [Solanum commersonii]
MTEIMDADDFTIKSMCKKLRGDFIKVPWRRNTAGWTEEIDWAISHATRKAIQDEVYRMTLAAAIYYVWQERNYRIFQKKERTTKMITRSIIREIHCRSSMQLKLAEFIRNFNYYP